jgi:hypothetical protein
MIEIFRFLPLSLSRKLTLNSASGRSTESGNLNTSKKRMAMRPKERTLPNPRKRRQPMWIKSLRKITLCSCKTLKKTQNFVDRLISTR